MKKRIDNLATALLVLFATALMVVSVFNAVSRPQGNKPGGKDPTVIWWVKAPPLH